MGWSLALSETGQQRTQKHSQLPDWIVNWVIDWQGQAFLAWLDKEAPPRRCRRRVLATGPGVPHTRLR